MWSSLAAHGQVPAAADMARRLSGGVPPPSSHAAGWLSPPGGAEYAACYGAFSGVVDGGGGSGPSVSGALMEPANSSMSLLADCDRLSLAVAEGRSCATPLGIGAAYESPSGCCGRAGAERRSSRLFGIASADAAAVESPKGLGDQALPPRQGIAREMPLLRPPRPRGVNKAALVAKHTSARFVSDFYEVIHELGQGTFSVVQLVRDRRSGQEHVCKVVNTAEMSNDVLRLTRSEVEMLAALDHPNIVKLHEYADDMEKQQLVLILEYLPGGDCQNLVEQAGGTLSEARVAGLIRQLIVAVGSCHSTGVVHRDIKPQNMMLAKSEVWGDQDCRLIDFGLAAWSSHLEGEGAREFVGTPSYMSPEVLTGEQDCTSKCDIWSIACTAIELLTGDPPFGRPPELDAESIEPVFNSIRKFRDFGDVSAMLEEMPGWAGRSTEARDFVRRLLRKDATRRPTTAQCLTHPWMERHRPAQVGLTADLVDSLAGFVGAPPLARCCLLAIAARSPVADTRRLGATFVGADLNGDGTLCQEELEHLLADAASCGWRLPDEMDSRAVFEALDLDLSGRIEFTEFVAGCLHGWYQSPQALARGAFRALDDDRDGLLQVQQLRPLLGETAAPALATLPQHRAIDLDEWRACFGLQPAGMVMVQGSWPGTDDSWSRQDPGELTTTPFLPQQQQRRQQPQQPQPVPRDAFQLQRFSGIGGMFCAEFAKRRRTSSCTPQHCF